ncbi:hypothetical protein EB796_018255 [Bugula neritina]|uniref:Uncharacterized protein n=1 Tax=Bugula neritina TaxID=10212 RepID=A0A7J7JBR0_BUGNE|nr:hypothetical protein EB796_018255 [Bugula neritina]
MFYYLSLTLFITYNYGYCYITAYLRFTFFVDSIRKDDNLIARGLNALTSYASQCERLHGYLYNIGEGLLDW